MLNNSPFLLFKVECPICKIINEFEMIRVGAYAEDGRDTDFCPMNVKWRYPRYQAYNPLVFFTATCSNCYYTREFTNSFKDWKNDTGFRTYRLKQVKEKHLEQLSSADSMIQMIGEMINIRRYPNESAILKLHLAVFDEQLAEHHSKLDLGRFYLRIGWIFRDMEEGENPQLVYLRGLMHELDNKYGQLTQTVNAVKADAGMLSQNIRSHFETDQISAELRSPMLAFQDRYDAEIDEFVRCLDVAEGKLSDIGELIEEYKTNALDSWGGDSGPAFGKHASFQSFLTQLQKVWPGVAGNEREALEIAVQNYKAAFASGRDIAAGTQQIQASYLIAELSRRIGDYDGAKEYFNSTIKSGQEFIYQNRQDRSRTVLARKILELAIEQGRSNFVAAKQA